MSSGTSQAEYWRQVSVIVDGKRLFIGPGAVMKTDGTEYVVTVNGKLYQRGTSSANSGVTPSQSDVTVTEGTQAGTTYSQIYQRMGDVLIGCGAKPGAARPTQFTSEPGSGHTLSVWVRIPESEGKPATKSPDWLPIVLVVIFGGGLAETFRKDFEPFAGYWGGLAAGWLTFAIVAMVIGLLFKSGWKKSLGMSVIIATAFLSFDEFAHLWEADLGAVLSRIAAAFATAALTAAVAAPVLWVLGGMGDETPPSSPQK
jgi:hypothetical protein